MANVVLMCLRVADLPTPHVPSRPSPCALCGAMVWTSLKSPSGKPIWCTHCALDEMDVSDKVYATKDVLFEAAAYFKRRDA